MNGGDQLGIREWAQYAGWREQRAIELVGPYGTKTAGALLNTALRRTTDGWIYGGRDALCFFADDPMDLAYMDAPGRIDQRTLVIAYQDCSPPQVVSAPGTPNLIVDFGGGREFVGAKDRMEHLVRLWQMWADSSSAPELWKQTAEVSGLPLYKSGARIASSPKKTFLGAIIGAVGSIMLISGALNDAQNSIPFSPMLIALAVIGCLGLVLLLGRWLPNASAGMILMLTPGAFVAAIILFARQEPTAGWSMMILMLLLVLTRLALPRVGGGFRP